MKSDKHTQLAPTNPEQLPLPTLRRLPYYYNILCQMEQDGFTYISSKVIAKQLGIDDTQVRKDIATTGYMGKPKVGFNTKEFREHLEKFLKMKDNKEAFLIGIGNLGVALAKYEGFKKYGLNIIGFFDNDLKKIGQYLSDREILSIEQLEHKIKKKKIKIAILTLPAEEAQEITNLLVKNGIKTIWNFAPVYLKVPENVFVWNENLAASFLSLSQFMNND